MKKIYNSPAVETIVLTCSPLLDGPGGGALHGGSGSTPDDPYSSAPKPRPDKPF